MAKSIKGLKKKIKKDIDKHLKIFFDKEIKKAKKVDSIYEEALKMIADFTLRGGKRIRASLMYFGYLATGKKENQDILKATLSVELIHTFALIQDDIIDNDTMRRGSLTLHKKYEKMFWNMKIKDPDRLGKSFALLCGDVAYSLANQVLCNIKFDNEKKIKALMKVQEMINSTVAGEMLDVSSDFKKKFSIEDVLKIYKYKTAMYTLDGPLIIGCILGGGDEKLMKLLSKYAIYLGVAFQIHDDMIGLFGDESETGKDVGSDVREGKKTFMTLSAMERGTKDQVKYLQSCMGKNDLKKNDLKKFRKIIVDCGAMKHSMATANNLSIRAKNLILKSNIKSPARDFLLGSADYFIERKR